MADLTPGFVQVQGSLVNNATGEWLYESHCAYDLEFLMEHGDEATNRFLARNRTGRGAVTLGVELGDSVQIPNGHWLTGKGWAEIKVPCHVTLDDYRQAAAIASSFARELASNELEVTQLKTQNEIDKLGAE